MMFKILIIFMVFSFLIVDIKCLSGNPYVIDYPFKEDICNEGKNCIIYGGFENFDRVFPKSLDDGKFIKDNFYLTINHSFSSLFLCDGIDFLDISCLEDKYQDYILLLSGEGMIVDWYGMIVDDFHDLIIKDSFGMGRGIFKIENPRIEHVGFEGAKVPEDEDGEGKSDHHDEKIEEEKYNEEDLSETYIVIEDIKEEDVEWEDDSEIEFEIDDSEVEEFKMTKDVLANLTKHINDDSRQSKIFKKLDIPRIASPRVAPLINRWSNNYYHFMIEIIPRFLRILPYLKEEKNLKIIVNHNPFVVDILENHFMIDPSKIIYIEGQHSISTIDYEILPKIYCNTIYFTPNNHMTAVSKNSLERTRKALLIDNNPYEKIPEELPEEERNVIVFITRRDEESRYVENEKKLILAIKKTFPEYEFVEFGAKIYNDDDKEDVDDDQIVYEANKYDKEEHEEETEEDDNPLKYIPPKPKKNKYLSFEDTKNLFKRARIVVGPHGAGLTNVMFCARGTPVVEFIYTTTPSFIFWHISEILGLDYYHLPVPYSTWSSNMTVNINSALSTMKLALNPSLKDKEVFEDDYCEPGFFLSYVDNQCKRCPQGTISKTLGPNRYCDLCSPEGYSNKERTQCVKCENYQTVVEYTYYWRTNILGGSLSDKNINSIIYGQSPMFGGSKPEDCRDIDYQGNMYHSAVDALLGTRV